MKLSKQIATFAGATAVALGAATMDAQAGGNTPPGAGGNPTPVTGCNGNPNCGGGGHTPTPTPTPPIHNHGGHGGMGGTGIGIGKGGMGGQGGMGGAGGMGGMGGVANSNSSATSNAVSNSGVNINTPRMVGNAPMAIAFANGECKWGVGAGIGTFTVTGGLSFAWNDEKCLDRMTSQYLMSQGLVSGRNELVVMGLATLNNISGTMRMATMQVTNGYSRCGKWAMENNFVLGAAIAGGAPCPQSAPRIASHYNRKVRAPKVVHKQSQYDCVQVIQQGNACRMQFPGLANR